MRCHRSKNLGWERSSCVCDSKYFEYRRMYVCDRKKKRRCVLFVENLTCRFTDNDLENYRVRSSERRMEWRSLGVLMRPSHSLDGRKGIDIRMTREMRPYLCFRGYLSTLFPFVWRVVEHSCEGSHMPYECSPPFPAEKRIGSPSISFEKNCVVVKLHITTCDWKM